MRATLKTQLKNCLTALKKTSGQRDKWVKAWPGQVNLSLAFHSLFAYSALAVSVGHGKQTLCQSSTNGFPSVISVPSV